MANRPQIKPLSYRQSTLAAALHCTRQTIRNMELRGDLPPRVELSPGLKVWPADVIDKWLAERASTSKSKEVSEA